MQPGTRTRLLGRGLGAATFVVLAVLFVGLTVLFDHGLRGARVDLTENGLYTLSPGTRRLVSTLAEPIDLYFYFSREAAQPVPYLRTYGTRVRELLEEIAARSGGKVRLHVADPQPYSDEEDRAAQFGLRAIPLGTPGESVYFGLAGTNSTDGKAVIEFFQPQKEEFLEYDVARLIHQLAEPKRRTVGVISSLPMSGGMDPESGQLRPGLAIAQQMNELYEVRSIPLTAKELPAGLDALVIVHPKGLAPELSYAIDQYLLRGGHALVFVDPDSQQDEGAQQPGAFAVGSDKASTLEPLLSAWGVQFDPRNAVGDLEHALQVAGPQGGEPVRHLAFAGFGPDSFAAKDVVTAALDTINFATPGILASKPIAGVAFEPLITTGTQAAPIPTARLAMAATPDSLRAGFKPTGQRYVIAARVSGRLPSAYAAGPPTGVAAPDAALKTASAPATVIVVADSDVLQDMLWVRTQQVLGQRYAEAWANNGDFVLNALDNLTGNADLISIRGRATFSRPFKRVEALRANADERLRAKEVELQRELSTTEQKLVELQSRRQDESALVLTPDQQRELDRFQQEKVRIRRELRETRHGLDQDIERLGTQLKIVNIAAMPLLLSIAALLLAAARRRRRREAARA